MNTRLFRFGNRPLLQTGDPRSVLWLLGWAFALIQLVSFTPYCFAQGARVSIPPDFADIRYGDADRHVLDVWRSADESSSPVVNRAPVVVYFHAGGFTMGDKRDLPQALLDACRRRGFAVVSANYRFSSMAPYPAPMLDAARVVQFLRHNAARWKLDPQRIVVSGRSAGAAMALWLAFHEEMANPQSANPIEQQSTRVSAVGVVGGQSTLDPREIAKLISPVTARHPALTGLFQVEPADLFTNKADERYRDASALSHVSPGDPPAFMFYTDSGDRVPPDAEPGTGIHHPAFGKAMKSQMDKLGLECRVKLGRDYNHKFAVMFDEMASFLWRAALSADESVEITRDKWGIAHVFADTEREMFYGAGLAMAEDRLLQMMLVRHEAEGELASLLGPGERDRVIRSDKLYRLLGLARRSRELLQYLQPDTRQNLEAFAAGLNAYYGEHPERLTKIANVFPKPPRPWEAADCITVWARNAYQFTTGWESEVQAQRRFDNWSQTRKPGDVFPESNLVRDDSAAIVSEEEFRRSNGAAYERLKQIGATSAPKLSWLEASIAEPKASHNWVVSGQRSNTGKPILQSNPQIPVSFPTTMYEIHLCGGRYDVRGVAFPGTPGIFIGWNRHCAWGVTALGGDHADLYQEQLDPGQPSAYLYRGQSRPFHVRSESIAIKGREPIPLQIHSTIHGPIVNELLTDVKQGEIFALKHTLLATNYSSLEAQLTMMRATDWSSFRQGMRAYVGPACNLICADVQGNIAYQTAVSTPKRRGLEPLPKKGWTGDEEWEMVPFDDLPTILNPHSNTIFTANHLPVGSWYPYFLSTSRGEGPRSWRLRELLAGESKLSTDDFHLRIHRDSTNPGVRDFVQLATRVLREDSAVAHETVDKEIVSAMELLENWNGELVTRAPAYPFARSVLGSLLEQTTNENSFFSPFGGAWAQYGGSWNGLNGMLKALMRDFRSQGKTPSDPDVRQWLCTTLVRAIKEETAHKRHQPPITHRMPYQNNLGQWGSLEPEHDLVSPPLISPVTQTIWSQAGETFVQIVDLSNIDRSLSLLPPGLSEDPKNAHSKDQISLWVAGEMHPAPLSRDAVLKVAESTRRYPVTGRDRGKNGE